MGLIEAGQAIIVFKYSRFKQDIRKKLFTMMVVKHWHRLATEGGDTYPWKRSSPGWIGLWATTSSWRWISPWHRGCSRSPLKVPSYPGLFMILWFKTYYWGLKTGQTQGEKLVFIAVLYWFTLWNLLLFFFFCTRGIAISVFPTKCLFFKIPTNSAKV